MCDVASIIVGCLIKNAHNAFVTYYPDVTVNILVYFLLTSDVLSDVSCAFMIFITFPLRLFK